MNAKISVFVICDEAIIYLLLFNLHDCTFKGVTSKEKIVFDFFWDTCVLLVALLPAESSEKLTKLYD